MIFYNMIIMYFYEIYNLFKRAFCKNVPSDTTVK